MWFFNCWWWWLGLGALLGWLLSWWLCRRTRANQPVVERVVEKLVDRKIDNPQHLTRIAALEEELRGIRARSVTIDQVAAKAAGFSVKGVDDLAIVEGIGPKIAELLHASGIHTFAELSRASTATIQNILDKGGSTFQLAKPGTWPQQADLAANNRWQELRKLQDELDAGIRK